MKNLWLAAAMSALCLPPSIAVAQNDSRQLGSDLGHVIGSEAACGLKYDQAAIRAFVNARVRADDMRFSEYLDNGVWGVSAELKKMSESQKAAHCEQVRRVAKTYKFISD